MEIGKLESCVQCLKARPASTKTSTKVNWGSHTCKPGAPGSNPLSKMATTMPLPSNLGFFLTKSHDWVSCLGIRPDSSISTKAGAWRIERSSCIRSKGCDRNDSSSKPRRVFTKPGFPHFRSILGHTAQYYLLTTECMLVAWLTGNAGELWLWGVVALAKRPA